MSKKAVRIPVVMKFDKRIGVDEKKLLIPETNTVAIIMQRVRERYIQSKVNAATAIFLFFSTGDDQRMFPVNSPMGEIRNALGNPTLIQIDVAVENTFGYNQVTSRG